MGRPREPIFREQKSKIYITELVLLGINFERLQPDAKVLALSEVQLRRSLPVVVLIGALGAAAVELVLFLVGARSQFAMVAMVGHLTLVLAAWRWNTTPLKNPNMVALGVYVYFATAIGISTLVYPNPGNISLLGVLSVAAFYFFTDRRYLGASQAFGCVILLVSLGATYKVPGWETNLLVCVATWVAGLSLHLGRVVTLQDLYHAKTALEVEGESRKQAEELNILAERREHLGAMVGGVAHDFNNLLAGIIGGIDLALKEESTDVRDRALMTAQQSAIAASDLCNTLLEFTRGQVITMSDQNVDDLVTEAVQHVRVTLPDDVSMNTDLGNSSMKISGDRSQLRQIIINLLSNAVDAAQSTVTCRTSLKSVGGDQWVSIEVEDDGPGIAPSIRQRIFDPFYTTKTDGKGLGLATVASSTRAHGGSVEVVPLANGGTRFDVQFPAVNGDVAVGTLEEGAQNHVGALHEARVPNLAPVPSLASVLADVFDQLPFLVFYKDINNQNLRVNRAVAELRGLPATSMENTPAHVWHPDEADDYYQADLEVIASGQPKLDIVELVEVKPGVKYWFSTDKYPTFTQDGEVNGVLAFCKLIKDRQPVVAGSSVTDSATSG